MNRISPPTSLIGLLLAAALAGCGPKAGPLLRGPATAPSAAVNERARVQSDLMNLADDFMTATADVYGEIQQRTQTPQKSLFVQSQKIDLAQAALSNAVNPRPLAGMMDMLVLVTLTRQTSQEPWSREILGPEDAAAIGRVLQSQEETMWRVAARYVSDAQLSELRELITKWRDDNPQQRYVAQVRMVDFVEASLRSGQAPRGPNSILGLLFLDPLAGIDPAVREIEQSRDTAERMFFYVQRMPTLVSWQVDMLYRRMLGEPQLGRAFADITTFSNATVDFAKATMDFAGSVETFRKEIPAQREQAIEQIGKIVAAQREQAINQMGQVVAEQRDGAIRQATTQISQLREDAINQLNQVVAVQRDSVLAQATTRISAEREATINQLMQSAQADLLTTLNESEQAIERSINLLYSRLRNLAILTISAIFVMLVVYRLIFRPATRERSLASERG